MASCPLPADNDVYDRCGDAGEKREKVEGTAGVGHEMEGVPSIEDSCVRVGFLAEKDEIAHAQMSAKADMDGQCADLEQWEKEKEQTEPEDYFQSGEEFNRKHEHKETALKEDNSSKSGC